jgi:hypothetical protein
MTIEIDVLCEMYSSLKQYIPSKDRQEAADNVMSVLVDLISDEELKLLGATDSKMAKALKTYAIDEDLDDDYNAEDDE